MTRKTVLLMLLGVLGILLGYWGSSYYVAYTDDASLETDIIRIAPRVAGHVQKVQVQDNQLVQQGQELASIDPEPFRLVVSNAEAELDQAQARMELQKSVLLSARAGHEQTGSALKLAAATEQRYRTLLKKKTVPRQAYDEKLDAFEEARARHEESMDQVAQAQSAVKAHAKDVAAAQARLEMAKYDASHTVLRAPVSGFVTALDIKPGDYAKVGQSIMAVVSDQDWRVMANYREQFLRHIKPGQRVLVLLDSHPWQLLEGTVQGVAKGVSRSPVPEKLLPYVEPKTNWIRLSRRFPVRIEFKSIPEGLQLLSGSDARTLVIY